MARPSSETLQRLASETGYQPGTLERVLRILDLLREIARDPILSERLALKGGTALDVFHLDLDRLSVDIDLNYVGALDRTAMESDRSAVDAAIDRLLSAQGYGVRRRPDEHAGGKWLSRYASALGGGATLALDVNYMARQPLFGAARMASRPLGDVRASGVLVLDLHEIVAGKIVAPHAICSTHAVSCRSRARLGLDQGGCVGHGCRRAARLADRFDQRYRWRPARVSSKTRYLLAARSLCRRGRCRCVGRGDRRALPEKFAFLFDLSANETAFLDGGEVDANLLDVEPEIRIRIGAMPMLAWKSLHVRRHREAV